VPFITSYTRKGGTEVRAHSRSAPGSRRELSIVAIAAVLVWGIGGKNVRISVPDGGHEAGVRSAVTAPVAAGARSAR
jgi:hypothetical protein